MFAAPALAFVASPVMAAPAAPAAAAPAAADEVAAAAPEKKECAWCVFMKGGPCKEVFEVWQGCVDGVLDSSAPEAGAAADADGAASSPSSRARKDAATVCAGVTRPLFECMTQHPEYYADAAGTGPPPPTPQTQPKAVSPSGASAGEERAAAAAAAPA